MAVADHVVHPLLVGRPPVKSRTQKRFVLFNGPPPDALHDEQHVAGRERVFVIAIGRKRVGNDVNFYWGRKIEVVVVIIVIVVHVGEPAAIGHLSIGRRRRAKTVVRQQQ
jgi:hypothetical protein